MGDRGVIDEADLDRLTKWIENGGVLIRFAGPRLAAQNDPLTPVGLRPTSRSMGSSLSWETPQRIAEFATSSPFFGIPKPTETAVRQQVLAQPAAELDSLTLARLEDGIPLVTAKRMGRGELILFHVTADPDWSDLPYTGVSWRCCGGRWCPAANARAPTSPPKARWRGRARSTASACSARHPAQRRQSRLLLSCPPDPARPRRLASIPAQAGSALSMPERRRLRRSKDWPLEVQVTEQAAVMERRGLGGWLIGVALKHRRPST